MSIAIGIVVGLILALTGAGGTIVAVPLLMFGLHLEVATAVPIALLAVCAAAGTGTILGLRDGIVHYRAAGLIALGGALLTPLGAMLALRARHGGGRGKSVSVMLALGGRRIIKKK